MTQEEKAKAYDEALEKASIAYKDDDRHLKTTLERIFPELKENDDKKIKNAILNHLKKMWENYQDDVCGIHIEDAIAWVEKQGEQTNEQQNGIGQYLDDSRVQKFAKKLCNKYVQKLYNPSNTEKNK